MRIFVYPGIAMLLMLAIQAGRCDGAVMSDVFNKDVYPLTVQLQKMEGWKCFTLTETVKPVDGTLTANAAPFPSAIYFTQGDTLAAGNELFLIAFHLPAQAIDITQARAVHATQPEDLMNPNTELVISLLNMHTINMIDIRPAEAGLLQMLGNNETVEQARSEAQRAESMSNLRQLIVGLLIWSNKNNNILPPMKSLDELKKLLQQNSPELIGRLWIDTVTGQPYLTNASLSGKALREYDQHMQLIVAIYSIEYPDGSRVVVFLDGHAENVTPDRWNELKTQSGLPQ